MLSRFSIRLPAAFAAVFLAAAVVAGEPAPGREVRTFTLGDGTDVEVRVFPARGDAVILGFPCDEGSSVNEEHTAAKLAEDGVEVWMSDFLSAYWLPDLPSSLAKIPSASLADLARIVHEETGKDVYVMAGGPDTELVLRALARIEQDGEEGRHVKGGLLLFPRLIAGEPDPGKEPEYLDVVGRTRSPLLVLEGGNTPNRWGLPHLLAALGRGGSHVQSLVVPDVRGMFYHRGDSSEPEEVVTSQLHGLIEASLFQLRNAE